MKAIEQYIHVFCSHLVCDPAIERYFLLSWALICKKVDEEQVFDEF